MSTGLHLAFGIQYESSSRQASTPRPDDACDRAREAGVHGPAGQAGHAAGGVPVASNAPTSDAVEDTVAEF